MSACSKGRYSAGGSCGGRIVSSDDCSVCGLPVIGGVGNVTFLMVERALVTFTETVTASPNAGDVGLMIGVPITGGCDGGGACARATEPATKARVKKRIARLRLVVMFIRIITEGRA